MKLIKVTNGLLEDEKFISSSSFQDYFNNWDMTFLNGKLLINTNEKIERNMIYPEFLIELNKENWTNIQDEDSFIFYVGNNEDLYGIEDNKLNGQSLYQKIIYNEKYLQTYVSEDKKNWTNLGGLRLNIIDRQGFRKISKNPSILKEYKFYRNPYITIQNFNSGTKVELYNENNNKLKERLFDENLQCNIFLDYCMKGYFKFYDVSGNLIYTSNLLNLQYGDTYCYSEYELEIEYKNIQLDDTPTCLEDTDELIVIKNISIDKIYNNLKIFGETQYDDIITLSLDGTNFSDNVVINEIKPNEKIDIYIRILKGNTNHNFICRDFELKLEQL